MTNIHNFPGSRNVGRASRGWWVKRIKSAVGLVGFAVAAVVGFFAAMAGPAPN